MDPPPSPRRDSTSAMLPPTTNSPRRSSSSTPTPAPKMSAPPPRHNSPGLSSSSQHGPPHRRSLQFRPKYYEGSPMPASTPASSIDGDLDAISEMEFPVTQPYMSPSPNQAHVPHHAHRPPPNRSPRNLVICLDGTHNSFCDHNSNVVRLFELLEKSDRQLCYYDSGVGTQQ